MIKIKTVAVKIFYCNACMHSQFTCATCEKPIINTKQTSLYCDAVNTGRHFCLDCVKNKKIIKFEEKEEMKLVRKGVAIQNEKIAKGEMKTYPLKEIKKK